MKRRFPPFFVTLFALGVLSLTIHNALRFVAALASWQILQTYAPFPGAFFFAASGFVWAVAGGILFAGLWLGNPRARTASLVAIILYPLYDWGNRLFLQVSPSRANISFILLFQGFWICFSIFALLLPGSKHFFTERERHDR